MTTTDPAASLAQLRRQVAALLAAVDTAILPAPTRVYRRPDRFQGREWTAGRGWLVYTLDTLDDTGFVYLDHACEDINYRWGEPGDWEALRVEQARRIGLALLAAAHHAEQTRTVTPLTTIAARTAEHREEHP